MSGFTLIQHLVGHLALWQFFFLSMGKLFSKPKKASRVTEVDRSILCLKIQRDQLVLHKRKLELECTTSQDSAKMYEVEVG